LRTPIPENELLAVGRITRAHGIHGEVAVLNLSEVPARYEPGSILRLEDGRRLTVEKARPHRHRLLVKFEEVPDRNEAETLKGEVLLVASDQAPTPPEGAYWVHQMVGMDVVSEGGRTLGRIAEVLHNPANDVWVAREGDREVLIPAVRDIVAGVDLQAGRVTVREVEGLLP
jgi:16S rRNA processing protein RimM